MPFTIILSTGNIQGTPGAWRSVKQSRYSENPAYRSLIDAYETRFAGAMTLREMPEAFTRDRVTLADFAGDDEPATAAMVHSRVRMALEHTADNILAGSYIGYLEKSIDALEKELWRQCEPHRYPVLAEAIRSGLRALQARLLEKEALV
ncbi:MAG: hypothetical protein JWN89_339 [Parcubacteria group bacterium]|nr:hypothetical protein [Parcubacteria group bacterium]